MMESIKRASDMSPVSSIAPRPLGAAYIPILLSEVKQEQRPSRNGDREAIVVGAGLCEGEGERAYTGYAPHIIRNVSANVFSLRRFAIFFAERSAAMFLPKRPDSVQNRAACLLLHQKNSNVNLLLNEQLWLPVEKRIKNKILCFVYRLYNDFPVPIYLSVPFFRYQQLDQYDLRNSRERKWTVRITNNTYGKRCFLVSGAELWNSLPCDLILSPSYDTFQARLKTYLF